MTFMNPEQRWHGSRQLSPSWALPEPSPPPAGRAPLFGRLDGITVVALALIVIVGLKVLGEIRRPAGALSTPAEVASMPAPTQAETSDGPDSEAPGGFLTEAKPSFLAPYAKYALTQGLHGISYGHLAVDMSAGEGAPIRSPIDGRVSARTVDELGNTVLVIENERYQVTLLHGLYSVAIGDEVRQGQTVGTESNQGNTRDWLGRSCRWRDCGYHTHLNVYDKWLGANVNPLSLWSS